MQIHIEKNKEIDTRAVLTIARGFCFYQFTRVCSESLRKRKTEQAIQRG